jgi:hypothetical protein
MPKKDNILLLLDNAGWSPEPQVIESLLTSPPDLAQKLEGGSTILESHIRNL